MSAAPAPGPWSTGGNYATKTVLRDAKGRSIASGGNNRQIVGEELEASLILAAAAPDLLAALRSIADGYFWQSMEVDEAGNRAREIAGAAIAKAERRS